MASSNHSIVESIFDKPIESIDFDDLKHLVEGQFEESPTLEFKSFPSSTKREDLIKTIVKSLVGFLNSDKGEGLLILGITGKNRAEEFSCIPKDLLGKNKDVTTSKLRNWIINNIKSIPATISPPKIYIRVFDCEECIPNKSGYVALIYVKRTFDALYYSAMEGIAYRREGDSTRRLSIEESLRIIEAKRQPIVIVLTHLKSLNTKPSMILEVVLHNIGTMPSKTLTFLISVQKSAYYGDYVLYDSCEKTLVLKNASKLEVFHRPLTGFEKIHENGEKIVFKGDITPITKIPIYPSLYSIVGSFEISFFSKSSNNRYALLELSLETYTENNHTTQDSYLLIDLKNKKSLQYCKEVVTRDYIGNILMNISSKNDEILLYDKERGINVVDVHELPKWIGS